VECTSLNESLAHSELFGHTRGASTGAHADACGLVEVANGGTLFFDEVGELSLALQGRLLRLLQEREYRPVGAAQSKRVDVYVIAATNRSLADMVEKGTFREDLYYRLRGATVRVAPLRDRPEDILPLATHFLHVHGARLGRTVRLAGETENIVRCYAWPGNARQLEHEIENIVAQLEDGDVARPWVVSAEVVAGAASGAGSTLTFRQRVETMVVGEAQRALMATGGNRSRAAESLGYSRRGFQKLLKRVGLVPAREKAERGDVDD
jgi:transcriptional regulator with PAS, ATPase and Fis domain